MVARESSTLRLCMTLQPSERDFFTMGLVKVFYKKVDGLHANACKWTWTCQLVNCWVSVRRIDSRLAELILRFHVLPYLTNFLKVAEQWQVNTAIFGTPGSALEGPLTC